MFVVSLVMFCMSRQVLVGCNLLVDGMFFLKKMLLVWRLQWLVVVKICLSRCVSFCSGNVWVVLKLWQVVCDCSSVLKVFFFGCGSSVVMLFCCVIVGGGGFRFLCRFVVVCMLVDLSVVVLFWFCQCFIQWVIVVGFYQCMLWSCLLCVCNGCVWLWMNIRFFLIRICSMLVLVLVGGVFQCCVLKCFSSSIVDVFSFSGVFRCGVSVSY